MKKIKSIHFVGIKGVGVAPLAIIAKQAGFRVSGCDIEDEFITDAPLKKAGIVPLVGFSKDHVKGVDLVITTGAHGGFDNEEVLEAKKDSTNVWTQGEAVGEFMKGEIFGKKGMIGISIAGSHGKTTTTAMLATVLKNAHLNPSFLVGTGDVPSLGAPGAYGKGDFFIAEADEYATEPTHDKTPKFLWQHPKILICTNIELDHPDLYGSIDDIRHAFLKFVNNLGGGGVLIIGGDDGQNRKLLEEYKGRAITFGKKGHNDFIIRNVSISGQQTFFWVDNNKTSLGEFVLKVPGEHNVFNALGAMIAALEIGLPIEKIREGLMQFVGTKRRFEYLGRLDSGALLFDDYAHHPTEIKKTLQAFRQSYPKAKIVCVFQPHTYSRTKTLFEEFIYSFSYADTVLMCNIYPSLREKADPTVSSKLLIEAMAKFHKQTEFLPKPSDVVEYIERKRYGKDTIIITMGAGDIYKIANTLLHPKSRELWIKHTKS